MFTVVFDACVLYPAPLRDLLMQLATARLFRVKWSHQIHDEWTRNLLKNRQDLTSEALQRTVECMNKALPDALVEGHEFLIDVIHLPDADDRHVVAAAIRGRADAIVTTNLRDFPASELEKHNLEAIHPDDFVSYQLDLDQGAVLECARVHRARLINPPKTPDEYLDTLLAQALPKTVSALASFKTLL
jgi:predicted nucleic acid-binding protein